MTLHQVIHLEHKICDQMAANGWLYAQGDATSNNNTSFVTQSNKNNDCKNSMLCLSLKFWIFNSMSLPTKRSGSYEK